MLFSLFMFFLLSHFGLNFIFVLSIYFYRIFHIVWFYFPEIGSSQLQVCRGCFTLTPPLLISLLTLLVKVCFFLPKVHFDFDI